jgi:cell filamentation protein
MPNLDPYVYPGTNVLRNIRGIRDFARLAKLEAQATSFRIRQLEGRPPLSAFNIAHLQAIHRHIFRDVYDWAGEFRTVNIGKSGTLFARPQHIASNLGLIFEELRRERLLAGLNGERFCTRAAYYLGEINAIHPFREGNGRTQREFIRQLGARCGHSLHWSRVTREPMLDASIQSFRRDLSGLEQVLRTALGLESAR